jgi:hypothetical protein
MFYCNRVTPAKIKTDFHFSISSIFERPTNARLKSDFALAAGITDFNETRAVYSVNHKDLFNP